MNPSDLNEIIRSRRSIYPASYTDQPVPDEVIREILENARWAPTHKLTEPWKFTVFTGEGLKKLAAFQSKLYRELSTAEGTFEEKKFNELASKPLKASHVIALGMVRDPQERIPEIEEISSVACAVQNMYLTAHAHGLGAYWGSGGITYRPEAKAFFGLETKDKLLGFFFIGHHDMKRLPSVRRRPLEEKVTWVD